MCFRPFPDGLIVATPVYSIEVDKRRRVRLVFGLPPHLTKDPNIRVAHQHLSQDIEAVRCVDPNNIIAVHKRAFLLRLVVVVVPMEGFA
jgi:hypothetical protein